MWLTVVTITYIINSRTGNRQEVSEHETLTGVSDRGSKQGGCKDILQDKKVFLGH